MNHGSRDFCELWKYVNHKFFLFYLWTTIFVITVIRIKKFEYLKKEYVNLNYVNHIFVNHIFENQTFVNQVHMVFQWTLICGSHIYKVKKKSREPVNHGSKITRAEFLSKFIVIISYQNIEEEGYFAVPIIMPL